jgi:hypothetical protein
MSDLSHRQLQFLILEICHTYGNGRVNKFNVLGKPYQQGDIERRLGRELSPEERAMAARAFDALVQAELLQSDYADMVQPENWVGLTPLGAKALERRTLDELDEALMRISPKLVELRDGMWAAWASTRSNALQQAAHSARELIDQTLMTNQTVDREQRTFFNPMPASIPRKRFNCSIVRLIWFLLSRLVFKEKLTPG